MARSHSGLVVTTLVAVVTLAGCAGLGGDGETPSPEPTTGPDVNESALRAEALAAIEAVEVYRVVAEQRVVTRGPSEQVTTVRDRALVNRTARELRRNRTVSANGRRVNVTQYLLGDTLYAESDLFVRQYSSRWVKRDVGENRSLVWRRQDTLGQLRTVLANASDVTVTGVESVDGVPAHRTRVTLSPATFEQVLFDVVGIASDRADAVTVTDVEYVYWLDRETARPLRTEARVRLNVTVGGQTLRRNVTTTARYEYEPASMSVSLPEAAEGAVNVSSPPPRLGAPARPVVTSPPATAADGSAAKWDP